MGLRHDILAALAAKHPEIVTLDDLMDATGERDRARLVSNLKAAQADGLIEKTRDEVTNQPAYTLTPTGLARHTNGKQQFNGKTQAENLANGKNAAQESAIKPSSSGDEVAGLLNIIADIRAAIGDKTGKIMLGDLAKTIAKLTTERAQSYATLDGIAHSLRGSGVEGLRNVQPSLGLQTSVAALTGAYQQSRAQIHDLRNDVAGLSMHISILRDRLKLGPDDDIIEALDTAMSQASPPNNGTSHTTAKLALMLIDSADISEIEPLDTDDIETASAEAVRQIEAGHAARAVVISIHGEAVRKAEWRMVADRKSTRLNSSHNPASRMPSSA
jgi:DNA-binding PadR family transcriptional regulator